MGLALIIIGLFVFVVGFSYFIYEVTRVCKAHIPGKEHYLIEGDERLKLILLDTIPSAFLVLFGFGLAINGGWQLTFGEVVALIFGGLILGVSFFAAISSFVLFYYKLDLDEKQRKACDYIKIIAFILLLVGLWIFTEGFANHITYPLISGYDFKGGWLRGRENGSGISLKFYGILIVSGALICYFITDHMTYEKFHKHGLIDTLFIVAFLSGVVCSRLWYCLILEPDDFLKEPLTIITEIGQGGLAIQGGAIGGAAAGITFMLLFRKYIDVRFMMDVAIPTILLAQVLGRWGNFFNNEVFGKPTTEAALWYLPTIVRKNMLIQGHFRVPLFIIEGTINLGGYFFIRYFLGKVCNFKIGLGYQASFYFIWYGLVRAVLEPLREGFTLHGHEGGFGYLESWYIAFGMIAAGIAMLVMFKIIHNYRMKAGLEDENGEKIKKA